MLRRFFLPAVVGIIVLALAVGSYRYYYTQRRQFLRVSVNTPLVNQEALSRLPAKAASSADFSHLTNGILPPTNSWLSGMVLQKTPLAVYPLPLSFLAKDTGFEVGLPTVSSTSTTITGEHVPGIRVAIDQAAGFKLSRYDKISATLTYNDTNAKPLATLTLAEGSPYVFYQSISTTSLTVTGVKPDSSHNLAQYFRYSMGGHDYVVVTQKGATIRQNGADLVVRVAPRSLVTFYALAGATTIDSLREFANNALRSVIITHTQAKSTSTTTLTYKTANGQPTLMAAMPYQHVTSLQPIVSSYNSIYGQMEAFKGNSYSISVPTIAPSGSLDLSHLNQEQKDQLITDLKVDVEHTIIDKTDSYYAGKQLARAANLLDIAEQLKQAGSIAQLKSILSEAFSKRLNISYFYYDTGLKGIVANNASFGSEDFNDHHFHYGYFLYAASILGKYDQSFVNAYRDQVNLLAADIASYQVGNNFPLERSYDPYAGHSWAAGLAPFSDGNNQESSSEAANAWNGVSLWGQITQNATLQQTGEWMLSFESATARSGWRAPNTTAADLSAYTSPVVGINFGGKRVYATFFSDLPSTKLGIQLIPLNPFMTSLAADKLKITTAINASITNSNYNVPLGDYVLMYLALANPQQALQLSSKQQDTFIDDGNSRTYLNAWILAALPK